jgi:membrane protease YdiL (CAAX protease family)
MGLFFVAALVAYRREGNPGAWRAFAARYRLRKLRSKDWLWTGAVLLVIALTLFGLNFTTEWLASMPLFAPHQDFPPELGPSATSKLIPGEFMGMALKGRWWVPAVFLFGWFLNVFGEEFWFRGYLLPRQEPAFGSLAWLVNALMFTFTHVWQPWNLLTILPGALFGVYVAQRRQNTWILIIVHGIMNISLFFVLLAGVLD